MSGQQKDEGPSFKPDSIKVQLFKKYTITYTDLYGVKRTITKTVTLSNNETVLENESLDRWKFSRKDGFPTENDKAYAEGLSFNEPPEGKNMATVEIINSILRAMQENKYIGGDLLEAVTHVVEGLGGKVEYSEYEAHEKREQDVEEIKEKAKKEAKAKK